MTSYLSFAQLPKRMLAQSCRQYPLSPYQIHVHYGALTLKAPITTAADDKFCDILQIFERNKE